VCEISWQIPHELEYLCDVGAAEILLPAEEFESDLAVSGSTLCAVPGLRERYQASREAIVRRMVQMSSERIAAVFLEYRLKPPETAAMRQLSFVGMHEDPQPKLRIAYVVPSERFTVFLPPHKSIRDESCVYPGARDRRGGNGGGELGRERLAALPGGGDVNAARRRCGNIASRCGTSHDLNSTRTARNTRVPSRCSDRLSPYGDSIPG